MSEIKKTDRAIVIFDSKFGNTAKVAKSLAGGLQRAALSVDCLSITDIDVKKIAGYDLIAVGAPTQALTASKPMKDFLHTLEDNNALRGKRGFAFDTRYANRFSGSASKYIEKKLSQLGMDIVEPHQSAIVKKSEGPLEEGELEAFEKIGYEMGTALSKHHVRE